MVCVCVCVCVYVYVCMCMYVCMYVYVYYSLVMIFCFQSRRGVYIDDSRDRVLVAKHFMSLEELAELKEDKVMYKM